MEIIRPSAVAGMFYPANPDVLRDMIEQDRAQATPSVAATPKVLIVTHAGYIYSGSIAASAFVLLKPYRQLIKRVVIIGSSHRTGFNAVTIKYWSQELRAYRYTTGEFLSTIVIPIHLHAQIFLMNRLLRVQTCQNNHC